MAKPGHVDANDALTETRFTVIVRVAVLLQPLALVPVTVYVVVTDGIQFIGVPLDALRPVVGDHEYVEPPVAVSDVELPNHTIVVVLPAVIVGRAFTVTALVVVFTHPLASVPVIVYVVVTVGDA